uniref:Uncharacterized protein n=1 Tax=Ralstonia solanacearum TaxID=305 RepID=A0A0S4UEF9_RALSL|nr:protein of unknown function [Ralstonia solanacearum]
MPSLFDDPGIHAVRRPSLEGAFAGRGDALRQHPLAAGHVDQSLHVGVPDCRSSGIVPRCASPG